MNMAERFMANNNMTSEPTQPCDFKVGDEVMFKNDYGVVFGPRRVIGFSEPEYGRFVHIDKDSPWFPVKPESLTLISPE